MDNSKKDFAIEVLRTRRDEIRTEEDWSEQSAWANVALTDAIEVLQKNA